MKKLKVADAKYLLQQLVFSRGWDKEEILRSYPELVSKSQHFHRKGASLYRVIALDEKDDNSMKPHAIASTSTNLIGSLHVEDKMPGLVFGSDKTISLNSHFLRFDVPVGSVLLDIDNVVLPAIKEKLKNVMNHSVTDKWGERIKISTAIESYEACKEYEVIADLSGLSPSARLIAQNHIGGNQYKSSLRYYLQGKYGHLDDRSEKDISKMFNGLRTILSKEHFNEALKKLVASEFSELADCVKDKNVSKTEYKFSLS